MSKAYEKAWDYFLEKQGEETPDFEVEFSAAWVACKAEVLEILKQDIQNCDLSWESCDKRYIERVKDL
jgi:hypothetical protein